MGNRVLTLIALIFVFFATAQAQKTTWGEKPKFAVIAAFDIVNNHASQKDFMEEWYDVGLGSTIGAKFNVPVLNGIFIESAVEFLYHTWGASDEVLDGMGGFNIKDHSFCIAIPLQIGYRYPINKFGGLSISSGPVYRYGISGNQRWKNDEHTFIKWSHYTDDGWRRSTFEWRIGLTIDHNQWLFGAGYNVGLTELNKKDTDVLKARYNYGTIMLGHIF